jgi:hypothetical protein
VVTIADAAMRSSFFSRIARKRQTGRWSASHFTEEECD